MAISGRSVVITRARAQAGPLADALVARGARVVEVPVFALAPPIDGGAALRTAVRELATFDWVVLTSANGVDAFAEALAGAPCGAAIAVVGSATAARARRHGLPVSLEPTRFVAESLLEDFPTGRGQVLVAQAEGARDVLALGLPTKGWDVTSVTAYRSIDVAVSRDTVAQASRADAIAFTSASTVERYVAAAGVHAVPPVVACIGPVTADAARAAGIQVDVIAEPHTIEGLVQGLDNFFARRDGNA